jgi:hypothetical protein
MFYGYDHRGIARIYGETETDIKAEARSYLAGRPDCQYLTCAKVSKTGKPLLQGRFKIKRV